jgi:hypothetical protein
VQWGRGRAADSGTWDWVDPAGPASPENVVTACKACGEDKAGRPLDAAAMALLPPPERRNAYGNASEPCNASDLGGNASSPPRNAYGNASRNAYAETAGQKRYTPAKDDDQSKSDQSSSPGVSRSDAYARDPALLRIVAGEFSKKAGRIIGDAEAAQVIAVYTRRAEEAGTVIRDAKKYFTKAIRAEADVELLLLGGLPTMAEILADPATPPAGWHPYEHDKKINACGHPDCGMPKWNARHQEQEAKTG